MFYQTQIKTLFAGGAIDTSGKRLQFIGNNPAQIGETVWTDGKVIFGDVPVKETPIFAQEDSGVPVLAEKMRGYFKRNGTFKHYAVAKDAWIVNDAKKFYHGGGEILDAEVAVDGALLTAEWLDKDGGLFTVKNNGRIVERVNLADYLTGEFEDSTIQNASVKLNRAGKWQALISADCEINKNESSGGSFGEFYTCDFEGAVPVVEFTRDEFEEHEFIFQQKDCVMPVVRKIKTEGSSYYEEDFGGHPYLKKALLALWDCCLFGDYKYDSDKGKRVYHWYGGRTRVDADDVIEKDAKSNDIRQIQVFIYKPSDYETDAEYSTTETKLQTIARIENGAIVESITERAEEIHTTTETVTEYEDSDLAQIIKVEGDWDVAALRAWYVSQENADNARKLVGEVILSADGSEIYKIEIAQELKQDDEGEADRRLPKTVFRAIIHEDAYFEGYRMENGEVTKIREHAVAFYFFEDMPKTGFNWLFDDAGLTAWFAITSKSPLRQGNGTAVENVFLSFSGKYKCLRTWQSSTNESNFKPASGSIDFPVQDSIMLKTDGQKILSISDGGKVICQIDAGAFDNLSAVKFGENYLIGVHGGKLYKIGKNGAVETVGNGLKNFRLREINKMALAKR